MSKAEIPSELPRLPHQQPREIMRLIVEAEQDAGMLAGCDRLALE